MRRSRTSLRIGWSLRDADNNTPEAWLPVEKAPSSVHVDLLANGKLLDPFLNTNELAVRWIPEKSWIYRLEFSLPQTASPIPAFADLVFEGLDTFATATLNGTVILESDNMHLHHSVPINNHLHREETNILEILFHSALLRGRELVKAHPGHQHFSRQTEDSCIPVHKAQYHWGWG